MNHGSNSLTVADEPSLPVLVSGGRGFGFPPDFPWDLSRQPDHETILIHIEVDHLLTVNLIGDFLLAVERGIRRSAPYNLRAELPIELEDIKEGSYLIKIVVPLAGLVISLGSFLNGLYNTFSKDAVGLRPLAMVTSQIMIEQGASAITIYSSSGVTLRVDRPAANHYIKRRSTSPPQKQENSMAVAEKKMQPLALPASPESETSGSGKILTLGGRQYVELAGREGVLVIIADQRSKGGMLIPNTFYNLSGHFETYTDGFPKLFVLIEASISR